VIYIFTYVFVPVTVFTCVRIGCALQLCCRSLLRCRRPSVRPCLPVFTCLLPYDEKSRDRCCVQTGRDFSTLFKVRRCWIKTTVLWILEKRRARSSCSVCCESWRNAELGVRAVCAVGDTTDEDRWVDLLCCSPHCDIAESCLTNDTLTTFSSSSDCYDDWRRTSPTVRRLSYDVSSQFRRCRLLRSCFKFSTRLLLRGPCKYPKDGERRRNT